MYAVENYGKDSLSRLTICYMMNSKTGNFNFYLSLYCKEEANYSQYSFIFNVLIPLLKNAEIIFYLMFPDFRRTISF